MHGVHVTDGIMYKLIQARLSINFSATVLAIHLFTQLCHTKIQFKENSSSYMETASYY